MSPAVIDQRLAPTTEPTPASPLEISPAEALNQQQWEKFRGQIQGAAYDLDRHIDRKKPDNLEADISGLSAPFRTQLRLTVSTSVADQYLDKKGASYTNKEVFTEKVMELAGALDQFNQELENSGSSAVFDLQTFEVDSSGKITATVNDRGSLGKLSGGQSFNIQLGDSFALNAADQTAAMLATIKGRLSPELAEPIPPPAP